MLRKSPRLKSQQVWKKKKKERKLEQENYVGTPEDSWTAQSVTAS